MILEDLRRKNEDGYDYLDMCYMISNAYSYLFRVRKSSNSLSDIYESNDFANQIQNLRRIVSYSGFSNRQVQFKCQVLTNLANSLDQIGRITEAIEIWDEALRLDSTFAMAEANKGFGLFRYALSLQDPAHRGILLHRAYSSLARAKLNDLERNLEIVINQHMKQISSYVGLEFLDSEIELEEEEVAFAVEEAEYRNWCLSNILYLHPLNDVGYFKVAASDFLHLPSLVVRAGIHPSIIGMFNQIKQEYIFSRYLLYLGIKNAFPKFLDKDTSLRDTMDYPIYGANLEAIKASIRFVYSLFDKIAFLLNHYYELGIDDRNVSFKSIWRTKGNLVHAEFHIERNAWIRSLYFMQMDFYDRKKEYESTAYQPDAKDLSDLRNGLEHRYVKVHKVPISMISGEGTPEIVQDRIAIRVFCNDLNESAMRLLKILRSALVSLHCSIHAEELIRAEMNSSKPIKIMINNLPED